MAEELGTAVLRITVDDGPARKKLDDLRREIGAATKLSSGGRAAIQEDERRFQIAQRIKRLEKEGVDVTRLRSRLQDANRARLNGDLETQRRITAELGRQVQLVERRFRPRAQGGASESVLALEKAQERRFRLAQKIDRLENQGADISRLRSGLGKVTEAQTAREFERQRRLSVELSRQVRLAEARLRVQRGVEASITREARTGGPRESIQGRRGLAGSPADIAFLARQGGARSPIGGATNIPGSPAFLAAQKSAGEAQAKAFSNEVARLARQGGARSPVGGAVDIPGSPAFLAAERRFRNAELSRAASIGGPRSPIGGSTSLAGSPAAVQAAEQRLAKERAATERATRQAAAAERQALQQARREQIRNAKEFTGQVSGALSSAVIGGAFPLLFGQGGGAAGGGLIGGLLGGALGGGGGFAGSLVGTVVGSTADKFGELAKALEDPVKNLDLLIQNANFSGKGVEQLAKTLVETGRTAEAEALIRRDLARTVDPVSSAIVAAANDKYARSLADVTEKLGLLLAGPATQFTAWLTDIINRVSGLPTGAAPTSRSALAVRGQGAALGIGGVSLAAVGLATGNVPAIAGGLGLAGLGQGQIAAAEFQEQQIAASASIEAAQAKIAVVETRRVSLQRQILEATRAGQTNAARDLQLADDLAVIDAARAKARADVLASPGTLSPAQLQAYRALIDSLNLQKEKIQENYALEKRNREAIKTLSQAQFNIDSAAVSRQIKNVTALGRVEQGAARDALFLRQQVTDEINAARDAESKIASSIQAVRTRGGGESTQELRDLYQQQGIASQQTELALKRGGLSLSDAARTLRKAGENLVEDLRRAKVDLTEVRSDPNGLNKFLNRGQQLERARQDKETLQPIFELAQRRFTSFTGAEAPEFIGSIEGVNAAMRDFINTVNREFDANKRVDDIQQALAENTAALTSINDELNKTNKELTTQVVALTQKDWNVYLTSNYTGSALKELLNAATLP